MPPPKKAPAKKAVPTVSGNVPARPRAKKWRGDDLSDLAHVITVRWDEASQKPVVGLDGMNPLAAYTLLYKAAEELYEELPNPVVEP